MNLLRSLQFWLYWVWVLAWRLNSGRWFIFRDTPDWLVILFALAVGQPYANDPYISGAIAQAKNELNLRLSRLKRDIEAAVKAP